LIIFFVFALQQKSRADKLQTEVDSLGQQVETMKSTGYSAPEIMLAAKD
jgi:hypothetical protein